ncbi:FUSC family protein [Saccharopolyspora shandongensis]|uniref:FUSC family protein n=1 Tax=Saccharopolyspora shandongensis TaxID=418495 RepID=UPI0034327CA2
MSAGKRLGLLLMMAVIVGGAAGMGATAGLGAATTLAALSAMFCFMAASGGALRPDLRLLAVLAPAMVLAIAVPRLMAEVSSWVSIALVVVVVFVAGLLPALGQRFVQVGLGLGMAALFSYGFQLTGTATHIQIIAAPVLAVIWVFLLRLLLGARDPSGPTRAAMAGALADQQATDPAEALRKWHSDRPTRWTGQVLFATMRYRTILGVLGDRRRYLPSHDAEELDAVLDAAREEAARLADAVRAPASPELPDNGRLAVPELPGGTSVLISRLWEELAEIRAAAVARDTTRVKVPAAVRQVLVKTSRGTLSWRSTQLRHAARCALGVLIALVIASFRPEDPLTVAFLMTIFAIMQPEWHDSLAKARERVIGALAGSVVLALVIWLLPQAALAPVALIALLIGFWFMRTQPVVFNGCIVLMSVGLNATTRHLDPVSVLVEYVVLILLALLIGLVFGFAAIPGVPKPGINERFAKARGAIRNLLAQVADVHRGASPDPHDLARGFHTAVRTQQELVTAAPGSKQPQPDQQEALDTAYDSLRGLFHQATALVMLPPDTSTATAIDDTLCLLDDDSMGTFLPEVTGRFPCSNTSDAPADGEPLPKISETELLLVTMNADALLLRQVTPKFTD